MQRVLQAPFSDEPSTVWNDVPLHVTTEFDIVTVPATPTAAEFDVLFVTWHQSTCVLYWSPEITAAFLPEAVKFSSLAEKKMPVLRVAMFDEVAITGKLALLHAGCCATQSGSGGVSMFPLESHPCNKIGLAAVGAAVVNIPDARA